MSAVADDPQGPTLALDGARLRPLRASDAAALYSYLRDPAVTERTSFPEVTPALAEAMIERAQRRWAAGEPSRLGIARLADDQLIGTCGFNDWSPAHRVAELAYDLARAEWGRGLMGQAVAAMLRWIFSSARAHRVQAFVRVDNSRSARVLDGAGFLREGRLRSYRICRGQAHDFYVYGLPRADWEAAVALPGTVLTK